ncbi:MAG: hypothetical protein ACI9S8_001929 [Chlamydiales bacterium]|jgi:hypothetical protein
MSGNLCKESIRVLVIKVLSNWVCQKVLQWGKAGLLSPYGVSGLFGGGSKGGLFGSKTSIF